MTAPLATAAAGLGTGFSLIVAIGAQNAYVLRQGVRREHVAVIVAICALSDLVLIALGTGGLGAVIRAAPRVVSLIAWFGGVFLLCYGFLAARRAWRPSGAHLDPSQRTGRSLSVAAGTALALTWLNPHVYLDTVLLLGSVGNSYASGRWYFAAGAGTASVLWFGGLGFGARGLSGVLARPAAWRGLDAVIAVMMVALGIGMIARA